MHNTKTSVVQFKKARQVQQGRRHFWFVVPYSRKQQESSYVAWPDRHVSEFNARKRNSL
jgi:hypothetical protein